MKADQKREEHVRPITYIWGGAKESAAQGTPTLEAQGARAAIHVRTRVLTTLVC